MGDHHHLALTDHADEHALGLPPIGRCGSWLLNGLAGLLPAGQRPRFVAEAQGNLGDCDHWWQRVGYVRGLVFGMPRLAWMMRRDGRRGRV